MEGRHYLVDGQLAMYQGRSPRLFEVFILAYDKQQLNVHDFEIDTRVKNVYPRILIAHFRQ